MAETSLPVGAKTDSGLRWKIKKVRQHERLMVA
jgi:hypothetical protein